MTYNDLDAEQLYAQLREQLQAWRSPSTQWVGIASGGAWIVQRLKRDWDLANAGVISSSMHRDDYRQRSSKPSISRAEATELPFDVTGSHIVLIDDVLYTGRTIRAVLNELFDYGRPASVRLAVLVDRGNRELPIQPDFAAYQAQLDSKVSLRLSKLADERFIFDFNELL